MSTEFESDTQLLSHITTLVDKKISEILIYPRSDNSSPGLDAHRKRWENIKSPRDSSTGLEKVAVVKNKGEQEDEDEDEDEGKVPFAKTIDHTLLKLDATEEMIDKVCEEARKFGFKSVCVNGIWANRVTKNLKGTDISTCVVVGFPLGASGEGVKAFETITAISCGASEIDLVLSIGHLKSPEGHHSLLSIYKDICSVVSAASKNTNIKTKATVKVILETPLLTATQIITGCVISALAGADYVKTCTGFNTGNLGATARDVNWMFRAVEGVSPLSPSANTKKVKVKASGGIRDFEKCLEMIKAGASRIGTSSGVIIMEGRVSSAGY